MLPNSPLNLQVYPAKNRKIGFGLLLALLACLPFELNQHPFVAFEPWLVLNNLKLLYYVNILAAVVTLWKRRGDLKDNWLNWRKARFWLLLLILICTVSTVFSVAPKESFKFTIDLLLGAILWLALPFWLRENRTRKLKLISYCLAGSAAVSAGLGLLKFVPGLKLNNWLLAPFKAGATVAGPFLRLSGTFEYANIAAIFYELALPFALANLAEAVGSLNLRAAKPSPKTGWWQVPVWVVACGLLWEALLLSFSRSALPGMLVAAPCYFGQPDTTA